MATATIGQLCDDAAVSLARVALLALDECDRLLSPEFEVATARLVLGCRQAAPRLILATATLAASAKVRLLAPNATRVAVGAALGIGALSASLELRFAVVEGRGAARLKALLAALADDEPAPTPEGSSAPTPEESPTPRASDDDDDDESGGDDDESSGGDDDSEEDRLDDAFVAMMRRRVAADASPSPRALVFVAHKRETLGVAADLRGRGRRAAALHGDLSQSQRAAAIARFRAGADDVLVARASRGRPSVVRGKIRRSRLTRPRLDADCYGARKSSPPPTAPFDSR